MFSLWNLQMHVCASFWKTDNLKRLKLRIVNLLSMKNIYIYVYLNKKVYTLKLKRSARHYALFHLQSEYGGGSSWGADGTGSGLSSWTHFGFSP